MSALVAASKLLRRRTTGAIFDLHLETRRPEPMPRTGGGERPGENASWICAELRPSSTR